MYHKKTYLKLQINKFQYRPENDEIVRLIPLPDHVLWVLIWDVVLCCTHDDGMTTRLAQAELVARKHTESVVCPRRQICFNRAHILRHRFIVVDPRVGGKGRVVLNGVAEDRSVVLAARFP